MARIGPGDPAALPSEPTGPRDERASRLRGAGYISNRVERTKRRRWCDAASCLSPEGSASGLAVVLRVARGSALRLTGLALGGTSRLGRVTSRLGLRPFSLGRLLVLLRRLADGAAMVAVLAADGLGLRDV